MSAPPYQVTPAMRALMARIDERIASADIAPDARRVNRIRAIRGSLAIEGNTLSEAQIATLADGKPVVAPPREVLEARNAIKVYDIYQKWNPGSEDDLLTAHLMLMTGLLDAPGHYRQGGVAVGGGGQIHHIGPPAARVPELMSALFKWMANTDEHPLIASSVFHYEFEFIHPFNDGNGRMGRLWQTLILTKWQKLFAHLPVESIVHAHQQAYYTAIRDGSAAGESTVFINFMLQIIFDALEDAQSST